MKVLCTTDFSNTSINALQWIYKMLNDFPRSELLIIHCIPPQRRADMLVSVLEILMERAEYDLVAIGEKFGSTDKLIVSTKAVVANPKSYITQLSAKGSYDLIVTGSTGLTSLKDITVGSVSQYLMSNGKIPILVIPPDSSFTGVKTAVLSMGKTEIRNIDRLNFVYQLLSRYDSKLKLVQVADGDKHTVTVDPRIGKYLKNLDYDFETISNNKGIAKTIDEYCDKLNADIVCMIHQQKKWYKSLFHHSITKDKLFKIKRPILIIPD